MLSGVDKEAQMRGKLHHLRVLDEESPHGVDALCDTLPRWIKAILCNHRGLHWQANLHACLHLLQRVSLSGVPSLAQPPLEVGVREPLCKLPLHVHGLLPRQQHLWLPAAGVLRSAAQRPRGRRGLQRRRREGLRLVGGPAVPGASSCAGSRRRPKAPGAWFLRPAAAWAACAAREPRVGVLHGHEVGHVVPARAAAAEGHNGLHVQRSTRLGEPVHLRRAAAALGCLDLQA
mmetsp:Transcript_103287/g.333140  ORF Transcript_103287/g.333140 Transcript_103287/m.333140 type:complete len:232 (+) Transcript_103287:54-749(+)